jgi:hypothetical protein
MEIKEYKDKKISDLTKTYNTSLSNEKKVYDRNVLAIKRNFLLPPFQKTTRIRKLNADYKSKIDVMKSNFDKQIDAVKNTEIKNYNLNGIKKALLIGVNYTNTYAQLNGCINDVLLVETYLKKEGFTDITFMTDKTDIKPTKQNIISALKKFLSTSSDNDILYLHYSGHGSYVSDVSDTNADETDRNDETIVSFDFSNITDDELCSIIKTNLLSKSTLISFFDSCHSGTILDLKYTFTENLNKLSIIENVKYTDLNANVIMISGCRDSQYSEETLTNTGINGLMTWALCQVLESQNNISWKDLYLNIRKKLKEIGSEQIPQLSIGSILDINQKSIF